MHIESKLVGFSEVSFADILRDIAGDLDKFNQLKSEWNAYKTFLQEKYPAENWRFTCEYHQRIDALINGAE